MRLYYIQVRYNDDTEYEYITTYDGVFMLAYCLDNSEHVKSIKVKDYTGSMTPRDFGYGEFKKW